MNTSQTLYYAFNTGLDQRRAEPSKGGPPDIYDTPNRGTALLSGIAELGYRSRNRLPLTCHWQGDDDPFWITEELAILAHHLGHHLLPAVDDLHDALPDSVIEKQVAAFYKRSMDWLEKAQKAYDALSGCGVASANAAWFDDNSKLYDIVHEFLNLFGDAQRLDSRPKASYPFRIRPTTVPLCSIP